MTIDIELHDRCLIEFKKVYPNGWTADECAERVGLPPMDIRPVVAALHKMGLLYPRTTRKGDAELRKKKPVMRFWTDPEQIDRRYEQRMETISNVFNRILQSIEVRPMTEEEKNLELWSSVDTTDPAHTKKVDVRGGFTAIDAYHQIRNATARFGPVGKGWGWDITEAFDTGSTIVITIELWHREALENTNLSDKYSFASVGQAASHTGQGDNKKPDADAAKKALTDAITKGLSYLGFNADVFLGKFDDSKYVDDQRRAHDPAIQEQENADEEWLTKMEDDLDACTTLEQVNNVAKANADTWREVGKRSDKRGIVAKIAIEGARARNAVSDPDKLKEENL